MYTFMNVMVYMHVYVHTLSVPCSDMYVPFCPIPSRWVGFQAGRHGWPSARVTVTCSIAGGFVAT